MTEYGTHTGLEKVTLSSKDLKDSYLQALEQVMPQVMTEQRGADGHVTKAIDWDKLRAVLAPEEEQATPPDSYEFKWVGKREAMAEAGRPSHKTLRPDLDESVNFEESENVFITGDNLEVLKLLQESYLGKVDMIYIDPPYNTGNDFVYSDKFQQTDDEVEASLDARDEEGRLRVGLKKNEKRSARYHSDWLNMIYPRLILARNLLKDSGVIFISIDDNEQANLKQVCDEVFGGENFVGTFPWQSRQSIQNDTDLSVNHEYLIAYAKKRRIANRRVKESNMEMWLKTDSFVFQPMELSKEGFDNPDNDPRGLWKAAPFDAPNIRPNLTYPIVNPNTGEEHLPPRGRHWRISKEKFASALADNRIVFGRNGTTKPQLKVFYEEKKIFGSIDNSWWSAEKFGTTTQGTREVQKLFEEGSPFDTPKPSLLLKKIITLATRDHSSLLLDFFAGSATTADAVMQLNAEDGGKRRYILCTLDEAVPNKSVAKEAGFDTIDQIARERIRRAAHKIQEEHPDRVGEQDFGFRAYRLDSSNFKDIKQTPDQFEQGNLFDSISNIKSDRSGLDLLIQVMLAWGLDLSLPIKEVTFSGTTAYQVADDFLIACFEDDLSEEIIRQIAQTEPHRAVFKDASFADSATKINLKEIFKEISPDTKVKVI